MNYFLIPGNPPAVHFYELWGKEIKNLSPEAQVRVSPYPLLPPSEDSPLAMKMVMEAHLKQLREFQQEVNSPLTVVGHSLGGYFALGLLDLEPEVIKHVVLIHPFIRRPSLLGQLTLMSVGSLYQKSRFQTALIKARKGLEYFSPELPFVTSEEILKSFQLARHESRTIALDESPIKIPPEHIKKIHVYYTHKDHWCRPSLISQLREQVAVYECLEPHGFVTQEKHRRSLFEKILALG